jgi:hypothetical protein
MIIMSRSTLPISAVLVLTMSILFTSVALPAFVEAKKVNLGPGHKITVRLQIDDPTSVHELSFKAKRVQDSDPFRNSNSRIPITVQIIENDKLVGSESVTAHIGNSFEEINIDMNNDPKVRNTFNVVVIFDIPEDDDHDLKIRVNTDSIKVIDNKKNDLDIVRVRTGN